MHFCMYINQVFPSGALFLVCTQAELKRLLLDLTAGLLRNSSEITAARVVGRNTASDGSMVCFFSKDVSISCSGDYLSESESPVMWPHSTGNLLIKESLACAVSIPLDSGESFCKAVQTFMAENFFSTLATMACALMAASYETVIASCGCIGVPLLFWRAWELQI